MLRGIQYGEMMGLGYIPINENTITITFRGIGHVDLTDLLETEVLVTFLPRW